MSEQREPIGVIGVGWVGLVTAACFAELGHPVIARDIVAEKVESLCARRVDDPRAGLAELLAQNAERLTFTTEMARAARRRAPALRLRRHAADLLRRRRPLPGPRGGRRAAGRRRPRAGHEEHRAGRHRATRSAATCPGLAYVSCPEFLKEGSAVEDFLHPDRVVIGADPGDEEAAAAVAGLYEPLGGEIVRTDVASAEMIKLASNAFLATKISFINEIANVCEEVGADVGEVARGMGLDERIGPSSCAPGSATAAPASPRT